MYSHVFVGSNDLDRSKKFYDAVFAAIGGKPGFMDPKDRLIYSHNGSMFMVTKPINGEAATPANGSMFMVTKPIDGEAATPANGGTIGFAMADAAEADAWHAAGVANGGTSVEDPPGVRKGDFGDLYLAYLRDPDGNKLCALNRVVS